MKEKVKSAILQYLPYITLIVALLVGIIPVTIWGQSTPVNLDSAAKLASTAQQASSGTGQIIAVVVSLITAIGVLVQRLESSATKVISELARLQTTGKTVVDPLENKALLEAIDERRRASCLLIHKMISQGKNQ